MMLIHTLPSTLLSLSEPNAVNAANRSWLSDSSRSEPAVSAAEAVCAWNRAGALDMIASRSFFMAVQRSLAWVSAATAPPLVSGCTFIDWSPARRPSSTCSNTFTSRASASPASEASAPPAWISATRRAMLPASTFWRRAM